MADYHETIWRQIVLVEWHRSIYHPRRIGLQVGNHQSDGNWYAHASGDPSTMVHFLYAEHGIISFIMISEHRHDSTPIDHKIRLGF